MAVVQMPVEEERVGERLIAAGWRSSTLMYELVHLCAQFEDSTEWALAGSPTASYWIASQLDVELSTAREWLRIGRLLRELPLIDAAFSRGDLSYSKVRSLTRLASAKNEAELLEIARFTPASQLKRVLAWWSAKNEGPQVRRKRHEAERCFFLSIQADGSYEGVVRLPPVEGGQLLAATDAKLMSSTARASADASSSLAQRRADALVQLVTEGGAKVETELVVHLRADGCYLEDGTPVGESYIREIAPESFIRALIRDAENRPINASSKQRHPTERQRRVVRARDGGCVDCGSTEFLQYDHVPDFDITHHTVVDELFTRCSRCHTKRHRPSK